MKTVKISKLRIQFPEIFDSYEETEETQVAEATLPVNRNHNDDIISAIPVNSELTQENNEKGGKR
jgi:type VI protein secretion system component VasK